MKQQLLKKTVLLFTFLGLLSTQVKAQETFTFDTTVEGWTANGSAPNSFAASIAYNAGSGANLGLAIVAPVEDDSTPNPGNTLTQNTIMYGPNNGSGGINADAYTTFTVTLKNETSGNVLRVRCRPSGGSWSQQNFTITANDAVFKTYTFTLNSAQWNGTDSDIAFVVRNTAGAWTAGTQVSYDSLVIFNPATYDGFVQNPSFDDVPGDIAPWSPATKAYATVDVTTGDARTGAYSMTHTYTGAPSGGAHFVFNNYTHDIGSTISDAIASSLWVKVVRPSTPGVSPLVTIQGQVRTGTAPGTLALKSNNQTTTKTDGTWEKLTFNLLTPNAAYQYAQFRYGLQITNLQAGDIVYIDDLSAINISAETTAQIGNWEDSTTWTSGNVPDANTDVTIAHTVTINSDAECYTMSINNTASTIVSVNAGNSLSVNGDVTTSNDIYLLSNSNSFSSLIVKGSINGRIVYQRFVGSEANRDLISVPVTGLTFGNFSTAGANSQLFENPANPTQKLFGPFNNNNGFYEIYDEVSDAGVTLVSGKGYRAATNSGSNLRFNRNATTSDVSIAITDETATGTGNYKRWNLIGNPYPSYLDFGAFFTENSSEFDTGAFQAIYGHNGAGTTIWNNLNTSEKIAPGQGFFVRAKVTGGTVNFKPAMQTIGNSDDFLVGRSLTPNNVLSEFFITTESATSKTKIYFVDNQTRGLDPGYDAAAFGGDSSKIFTHLVEENTGIDVAIQALPYEDFNDVAVPLGIKTEEGIQATIGLDMTATNIPTNINIYLEDNVANTWTLLNNSDYIFTPPVALNGTGRFYLHYSNTTLSIKDDAFTRLNISTDQTTKQIIIDGQLNVDTVATIYDIQGRTILSKSLNTNRPTNTIDANNLSTGIYIVKVQNISGSKSQKIILR